MNNLREIFLQESIAVGGASFVIPEGIKKNYKMDDNLENADKWKAKIILGNSMPEGKKKGDWDDVGYIWISLDSNVIVPIAQSDEHYYGGDLIDHYMKKKLIPREKYYPIWANEGCNYVYDNDVPQALQAFKKFRAYGGKNVLIQNWKKTDTARATADMFIKQGGDLKIKKGQIAEGGQRVIDLLKQIEELYKKYQNDSGAVKYTATTEKKIFSLIYRFIKTGQDFEEGFFHHLDLEENDIKKYEDRVVQAEGEENVQKAINAIFAYGGLKNDIHNRLREVVRKSKSDDLSIRWKLEDLRLFFGDLDEVIHVLGGI